MLVDFYKYGCQPCQIMDGIVNEIADDFQDEAIVIKANLETVPDLFGKFKVMSTPTFVLLAPSGNGLNQRLASLQGWSRRTSMVGKRSREPLID